MLTIHRFNCAGLDVHKNLIVATIVLKFVWNPPENTGSLFLMSLKQRRK